MAQKRRRKKAPRPAKPGPLFDPTQEGFTGVPAVIGQTTDDEIVASLNSYKQEAQEARKSGPNPRDDKWQENLDLYWGRYDWSAKASWQAKEAMPEVPGFVDRFAAALKEALMATPEGFYSVEDPADREGDLSAGIKRATDVWLSTAGRNQNGHMLHFSTVFEEQVKLGSLMACSSVVTWKNDTPQGRVAVETADPQHVWLDPTNRNLYRLRQIELDRHDLVSMSKAMDAKGRPIYNLEEMTRLMTDLTQLEQQKREDLVGHGTRTSSGRQPIVLDEYIATVLNAQGDVISDQGLYVVANDKYLLRGPEANPFWHGRDWLVFSPLVNAPLSVYGRSYMEDFGSVAKTFNELTNLLLDAVHASSLNATVVVPAMLANPEQLAEGVTPFKTFMLEEGYDARAFAQTLELGTMSAETVRVWSALKDELREAASMNEVGMGQFAPNSRTSATEVIETQQSSSAVVRSIAQTVETRWLNPTLDLMWKTGLQHVKPEDEMIRRAVGDEMFNVMLSRRKEFIRRPVTFQARGISDTIQKSRLLHSLITILGIISQNEQLLSAFMQEVDMTALVNKLFELSNIDLSKLQTSDRDKMIRAVTQPLQAAGVPGQAARAAPAAQQEMGNVARAMGVSR